jgi:uncharacterized SAM-binding protein YcdF (DUF218 family)
MARQGPPPRCDAIVVPGCPARADGTGSTCIARRGGAAVAAWREGAAPVLVLSGGAAHNHVVEAQVMADHARALGVPDRAGPHACHTTESLRLSGALLRARGWRRVLVVTDALQLPFALHMADHSGRISYGRFAHPPLPPRELLSRRALDDLEPIPRWWWK